MNNIQNNVNFKGTFLINYKNSAKGTKEALENLWGNNGKQIFNNWKGVPNKTLYVLRNSKDYDTACFIKQNNIEFEYMPEIDTHCGLDNQKEREAIKYIKENAKTVITNINHLMGFVSTQRAKNRMKKDTTVTTIENILDRMLVGVKGTPTTDNQGITKVIDTEKEKVAILSPQNRFGTRFVRISSVDKRKESEFYAVDWEGNILRRFEDADGLNVFRENFIKAVNFHESLKKYK